jgi:outer membrane lipoprotein-sorting protein
MAIGMRRTLSGSIAAAALGLTSIAVFITVFNFGISSAQAATLTQRDRDDLARISAYLNDIRSMQGNFVQVGPNGELDQGIVYVRKPGRLRFEYSPPSPYLIVSDGVSIAVGNSELKTVDRYPLLENPLSLILGDMVDLNKDKTIATVERKPGQISVTAKRDDGSMKGQVTMIFADPAMELRQWVITDAQGLQTMVALQKIRTGVILAPELFILRDVNKFSTDDH